MWILAFSVPGFSNLFIGSVLNALDVYMKYTAELVPLRTYIVWFISARCNPFEGSVNKFGLFYTFDDQLEHPWTISISYTFFQIVHSTYSKTPVLQVF